MHDDAPDAAAIDWWQILQLYSQLQTISPSPIVALNRAVAVAEVEGPDAAAALGDDWLDQRCGSLESLVESGRVAGT